MHPVQLRTMITLKRRKDDPSLRFSLKGGIMKGNLYNWLHDLGVALGLIPPPLQPVPIPTEKDDRRRQQPRR